MKKLIMKLKEAKTKAFTLVEMLIVLLIISVLLLLFVPNLTKQKDAVNDKGKAAVVKVVESQAELYSLDKNEEASLNKLEADGRITAEQAKAYKEYHVKQNKAQTVADQGLYYVREPLGVRSCQSLGFEFVKFCPINICSCRGANILYGI